MEKTVERRDGLYFISIMKADSKQKESNGIRFGGTSCTRATKEL